MMIPLKRQAKDSIPRLEMAVTRGNTLAMRPGRSVPNATPDPRPGGKKSFPRCPDLPPGRLYAGQSRRKATASISTAAPLGRAATCTVLRAGGRSGKNSA